MSDKELKIAAARKKLKQYQKKKCQTKFDSRETSPAAELERSLAQTPESILSSRCSSVSDILLPENVSNFAGVSDSLTHSTPTGNFPSEFGTTIENIEGLLPNYFNANIEAKLAEEIENEFPQPDISQIYDASIGQNNIGTFAENISVGDNSEYQKEISFEGQNSEFGVPISGEFYAEHSSNLSSNVLNNSLNFTSLPESGVNEAVTHTVISDNSNGNIVNNPMDTSTTEFPGDSVKVSDPNITGTRENIYKYDSERTTMKTEAFQSTAWEISVKELESQNAQLTAHLEFERQSSLQKDYLLEELKSKLLSKEEQLETLRISNNGTNSNQMNGLREQLTVHIQTIGILVAEKSELQSNVEQLKKSLDMRINENGELKSSLEASKQKIHEVESHSTKIERNIEMLNRSTEKYKRQIESSQENSLKMNQICDELRASVGELSERLSLKTEECERLSNDLLKVQEKLDLSIVHVTQLRDSSIEELQQQFEDKKTAHGESIQQVEYTKKCLEQSLKEKNQLESDYKNYTTQLALETDKIKADLDLKIKEIAEISLKNDELSKQVSDLTKQEVPIIDYKASEAEKNELHEKVQNIELEKTNLLKQCESLARDNGQLSNLVTEQSQKIESLEIAASEKSTQQVDTTQLLNTMQSDKVAAARALKQNKALKEQLEELQTGLILMSNKKLELSEKLENELFRKKSVNKELVQLVEEVGTLKDQLLKKDVEISELKNKMKTTGYHNPDVHHENSHILQSHKNCAVCEDSDDLSSIAESRLDLDRNRISESIEEMDESQDTINDQRNDDLISFKSENSTIEGDKVKLELQNKDNDTGSDKDTDLQEPVDLKNREQSSTGSQIEKQEVVDTNGHHHSGSCTHSIENSLHFSNNTIQSTISGLPNALNFSGAEGTVSTIMHQALEKRFLSCMTNLAAITEERNQLEHLVQQLQLETDTVGDYITIYQFQRGVMRQKMKELNYELDLMKTEKEETKGKVLYIQTLVTKFLKDGLSEGNGGGKADIIDGLSSIIEDDTNQENETGIPSEKEASKQDINSAHDQEPHAQPQIGGDSNIPADKVLAKMDETDKCKHPITSQPPSYPDNQAKHSQKSHTVRKIMDILGDIENNSQIDLTSLHKFHPCKHCSGKLINV